MMTTDLDREGIETPSQFNYLFLFFKIVLKINIIYN